MSSFEWAELQTVATEIAAMRSRLSAARLSKNRDLVQALEEEIAASEARRTYLRGNITPDVAASDVVGTVELAGEPEVTEDLAAPDAPAAVAETRRDEVVETESSLVSEDAAEPSAASEDPAEPSAASEDPAEPSAKSEDAVEPSAASEDKTEPSAKSDDAEEPSAASDDKTESSFTSEGAAVMSDQLVAIDTIERANQQLDARRAEMLARHAEEIKALDADQSEVDAMAQAMDAFIRKFNLASGRSVVQLDEERDMRQQIHG